MYNRAFIIGNLTRDPDLRHTPGGVPCARFSVAVNRRGKNGDEVDFIPVVAWRRLAEICGEYLKKGRQVAIEGRLRVQSYKAKDGQTKVAAEIVADNMQMLGKKSDDSSSKEVVHTEVQVKDESKEEEVPF